MRMTSAAAALAIGLSAIGLSGCADSMDLIPSWGDDARPATPAPDTTQTPSPVAPAETAPPSVSTSVQPVTSAENAAPGTAVAPAEGAPPAVQAAQAAPMPAPAATNNHCRDLASLRSRDAAYSGEDEETQESVYNRTYAECVAWDARHRL